MHVNRKYNTEYISTTVLLVGLLNFYAYFCKSVYCRFKIKFDVLYYREFQSENKCLPCHSSCDTCLGPHADNCLSCHGDTYLHNSGCHSNCPEGYYTLGNECHKCDIVCKTCVGEYLIRLYLFTIPNTITDNAYISPKFLLYSMICLKILSIIYKKYIKVIVIHLQTMSTSLMPKHFNF